MPPTPDRIRTKREVTAMVALDTVELLAERVVNLLDHGRRITLVEQYLSDDINPPEVTPGLPSVKPTLWRHDNAAGINVHLEAGGHLRFGFSACRATGADTETAVAKRFNATRNDPDERRSMTEVRIRGGLPNDGPARNDQITIRHWNAGAVCLETIVAFDYETGPAARADALAELITARDDLRKHMDRIRDQQPWDNKAMFDRLLTTLDRATGSGAL